MPTRSKSVTIRPFGHLTLLLMMLAVAALAVVFVATGAVNAADSPKATLVESADLVAASHGNTHALSSEPELGPSSNGSCATDYYSALVASGHDGVQGWSLYYVYSMIVCADGTTIGPFFEYSYVVNW